MSGEWHRMSALALGAGIEGGAIDPRALTEFFLERIEEVDGDHAIYLRLTAARARAEAEAAHRRAQIGLRQSPLDGVPISWKDLYDSAGDVTSHGTLALADRVATGDAKVLARATRAGLVCLGKTNQTEFAFSILGLNPKMGTPPNPFDEAVARIPGGSSSGAAVSVSRGLAAAAIGSDTGGSVRVPAAWNGLVGLKTSFGLLPLEGVLGLSTSMDTVGPLTRDVADAAALFAILDGRFGAGNRSAPDLAGSALSRARFALPTTLVWDSLDPGVETPARSAVERLRAAGCAIDETPVPEFDTVGELVSRFGAYHAAECHALWYDVIEARPDLIYAPIWERIRVARRFRPPMPHGRNRDSPRPLPPSTPECGGTAFSSCPQRRQAPRPSPRSKPTRGLQDGQCCGSSQHAPRQLPQLLCADAPCGRDQNGVPVGLMLMAPPGDEEHLLRLGHAIEPVIAEGA